MFSKIRYCIEGNVIYRVLYPYSFEELIEHINENRCRLSRPKFETFWNSDKMEDNILEGKIVKNNIILYRPHTTRRGFQRNFKIKVTKQTQGLLLEGKFVIPPLQLSGGIPFGLMFLTIYIFALINLDRALPTSSMTSLGKILVLTLACCWGLSLCAFYIFGGKLIYRQGEKEVLEYFKSLGAEVKADKV